MHGTQRPTGGQAGARQQHAASREQREHRLLDWNTSDVRDRYADPHEGDPYLLRDIMQYHSTELPPFLGVGGAFLLEDVG
jgi:hypothetical protein